LKGTSYSEDRKNYGGSVADPFGSLVGIAIHKFFKEWLVTIDPENIYGKFLMIMDRFIKIKKPSKRQPPNILKLSIKLGLK